MKFDDNTAAALGVQQYQERLAALDDKLLKVLEATNALKDAKARADAQAAEIITAAQVKAAGIIMNGEQRVVDAHKEADDFRQKLRRVLSDVKDAKTEDENEVALDNLVAFYGVAPIIANNPQK
jgi:regulator of protease activity HflC (stomatin/prohibitin superfamily)